MKTSITKLYKPVISEMTKLMIFSVILLLLVTISVSINQRYSPAEGVYVPTDQQLAGDTQHTDEIEIKQRELSFSSFNDDQPNKPVFKSNKALYNDKKEQTAIMLKQLNPTVEIPELCVSYLNGLNTATEENNQEVMYVAQHGVNVYCENIKLN